MQIKSENSTDVLRGNSARPAGHAIKRKGEGKRTKKNLLRGVLFAALMPALSVNVSAQTAAPEDEYAALEREHEGITIFGEKKEPSASITGEDAPVREIPQSVSIIDRERMEELNLTTVDEAMKQVTGVTVVAQDNTRSQYRARGYSMTVMTDGLPAYNSLANTPQFDLSFYEQVEVLRGPAGLLQGAPDGFGIGGLINLVKKRPTDKLGIQTTVSAGRWSNFRGEIDLNVPLNPSKTLRSRWMVFANDRDFFFDRSHLTKTGALGVIEWDITPSTLLSLSYSFQNIRSDAVYYGIPAVRQDGNDNSRNMFDAPRNFNPTPDWDYAKWETHDLFFYIKQTINDDWQASLKFDYRMQTGEAKQAIAGTINRDTPPAFPNTLSTNYTRRYTTAELPRLAGALDVKGRFRLFKREHSNVAGFNVENFTDDRKATNDNNNRDRIEWGKQDTLSSVFPQPALTPSKSRYTQFGLYDQLRVTIIEPLKVVLGGRLGSFYEKQYNFSTEEWKDGRKETFKFTPFAGIVYTPIKPLTVYASYSQVFVPQTEKKQDGSTVDPRTGMNIEAGAKSSFFDDILGVNLAYFFIRDVGRAYMVPGTSYYNNDGKVYNQGIDAEISVNLLEKSIELTAGYTWLKTKIVKSANTNEEGKPASTVEPEHSFKFLGSYNFRKGPLQGLSAGVGVTACGPKYVFETPERRQGGYAVLDIFASYAINSSLSINLNLNNITDTVYYARVGGDGDYFGEPFSFNLTLRGKF